MSLNLLGGLVMERFSPGTNEPNRYTTKQAKNGGEW
jgi:hypothetical protein